VRPTRYRITLRGRLSERFACAFEGMALEPGPDLTVLVGDVRDQAQLNGLLDRLRDFGFELVALEPPGPDQVGHHGHGSAPPSPGLPLRAWRPESSGRPP